MVAIQAYYDGNAFIPVSRQDFRLNQSAIIVVDNNSEIEKIKGCRGIASKYANPSLIEKEDEYISRAFMGDLQ